MVDSADRATAAYPLCNNFQINKRSSILNGFFTRVGATEVVFEWNTPNVSEALGSFIYNTLGTRPTQNTFTLSGFLTMAEALDGMVAELNTFTSTTGLTWVVDANPAGGVVVSVSGGVNGDSALVTSRLLEKMNDGADSLPAFFDTTGEDFFPFALDGADLRPTRYIDIVCNQLTNNQSVKDASTAPAVRDVLVRWYFDFDNQNPADAYGFPILMGYAPFYLRRLYNPPKQIQWQTNIPIGNMSFQLYGGDGELQPVNGGTQFLMTLQISEN